MDADETPEEAARRELEEEFQVPEGLPSTSDTPSGAKNIVCE